MEAVALRQRRPEPRHADRPPGAGPERQLPEHGCRFRAAHGDDVESELELGPRHERPPHEPDAPLYLELDARDEARGIDQCAEPPGGPGPAREDRGGVELRDLSRLRGARAQTLEHECAAVVRGEAHAARDVAAAQVAGRSVEVQVAQKAAPRRAGPEPAWEGGGDQRLERLGPRDGPT